MNLMGKIIAINLVACFLVSLIVQSDKQKQFSGLSIGFDKPNGVFKFWTSFGQLSFLAPECSVTSDL